MHLEQLIPFGTNSRHHQCADPNNLPEELQIIAFASEPVKVLRDGKLVTENQTDTNIPEIIVHKTKKIFLFQGHLEDLPNQILGSYYFDTFLN